MYVRLLLASLLVSWGTGRALAEPVEQVDGVVVVGGGPGGLNAARQAALNGAKKVVVLEMRPQHDGPNVEHGAWGTRQQFVNLRTATLNILKESGLKNFDPVTFLKRRNGKEAEPPKIDAKKARPGVSDMVRKGVHGVGAVPIGELEHALAEDLPPGVEIRYGSRVVDLDPESSSLVLEGGKKIKGNVYVIAAGAHDLVRDKLGIDSVQIGETSHIVQGIFTRPGEQIDVEAAKEGGRRAITLGIRDGTTFQIKPPEGKKFGSQKELETWFLGEAKKRGVEGELKVPPKMIDVRHRKVTTSVAYGHGIDTPFLIIGDANREASFFTGQGVNFAFKDGKRVGRFVKEFSRARTPKARRRAVTKFAKGTTRATNILLKNGTNTLPRSWHARLGGKNVDTLLRESNGRGRRRTRTFGRSRREARRARKAKEVGRVRRPRETARVRARP